MCEGGFSSHKPASRKRQSLPLLPPSTNVVCTVDAVAPS